MSQCGCTRRRVNPAHNDNEIESERPATPIGQCSGETYQEETLTPDEGALQPPASRSRDGGASRSQPGPKTERPSAVCSMILDGAEARGLRPEASARAPGPRRMAAYSAA